MKLPGLRDGLLMHGTKFPASVPSRPFDEPISTRSPEPKRRRIWELNPNFHCSIIGTCLTTSELRQILTKIGLAGVKKETDHELHGCGVLLAARRDVGSKLLQKALDRRHRCAIASFGKARTQGDLKLLWASAVQGAAIPGAYWAVLTHPEATQDIARHVFGEVHMLSHLVGAANRADIRRLRELEGENANLLDKVARQQRQLRDAVVARDATIASLNEMLGKAIAAARPGPGETGDCGNEGVRETTAQLIAELRRQLASETSAREKVQRRVSVLTSERDTEKKHRLRLEERERELRSELEVAEHALSHELQIDTNKDSSKPLRADGLTILYVGGRANLIAHLRLMAERAGAQFLHHDGGIDDRSGLLAAHVARADYVVFPVDCVSHGAVAVIKKTSRNLRKPYLALRSSGLTTFVAALRTAAATPSTGKLSAVLANGLARLPS